MLGAVVAGLMLKDNLSEGPKMLHRLSGQFAGLVGIAVAVRVMQLKSPNSWKLIAWAALVGTFLAGISGIMLSETSNYDITFAMMRLGGVGALLLSVTLLVKVSKDNTKKS